MRRYRKSWDWVWILTEFRDGGPGVSDCGNDKHVLPNPTVVLLCFSIQIRTNLDLFFKTVYHTTIKLAVKILADSNVIDVNDD